MILETVWNLSWNRARSSGSLNRIVFYLFLLPLTRRYVQSSLLIDIVLIFNPSPKFLLRPDSFRKQFGPSRQTDMIQWPTHLQSRTHSRILPSRASSPHALPMQRWLHSVHIALWQHSITRALYRTTGQIRTTSCVTPMAAVCKCEEFLKRVTLDCDSVGLIWDLGRCCLHLHGILTYCEGTRFLRLQHNLAGYFHFSEGYY